MNNLQLYVPISSAGLAHYFAGGIILPASLYGNRPNDIQTFYSDVILVSEHKWLNDSDCSIQVVLTQEELSKLNEIHTGIYQYPTPIPISRIKKIWFLKEDQMRTTVWNVNNGTAFITDQMLMVESGNPKRENAELKKNETKPIPQELKDKTRQFDVLLGGLAFMKVGGLQFMEYSKNYFKTLAFFNRLIRSEIEKIEINVGIKFKDAFHGLFTTKESEWTPWIKDIYGEVDVEAIDSIAKRKREKVVIKYGMVQLDSINRKSHIYELAVISIYGENKNKSIDQLVRDLENGVIDQDKVEDIALVFGLNNGYRKFRNYYDRSKGTINVKFKMDSLVDYYTIESIFQFVFNKEKENRGFDYIESWCPRYKAEKTILGYETYTILDKTIAVKKKPTLFEVFFQNYFQEINQKISRIIQNWISPPLMIDERIVLESLKKGLSDITKKELLMFERDLTKELNAISDAEKKELQKTFDESLIEYENKISELKKENMALKAEYDSFRNKYINLDADPPKPKKKRQDSLTGISSAPIASNSNQGDEVKNTSFGSQNFNKMEITISKVSEPEVKDYKYVSENEDITRESLKEKSVIQLKEIGNRFKLTYKGNKSEFIERILSEFEHNQEFL